MGKFDGYLFCSDLDGTLRGKDATISRENSSAIRYFQNNGGLFTVATGRSPNTIYEISDAVIPNTHVIALNGTMLYDLENRQILSGFHLDDGFIKVLQFIRDRFDFIRNFIAFSATHSFHYDSAEKLLDHVFSRAIWPCYKIIFCQDAGNTLLLQEELISSFGSLYQFNRSWPEGLELQSINSGKGECIPLLKKYIKEEIHTTICIGDYENDISMIKAADIGYAVANALDIVKQAADRITVSNDENAIARIIEELDTSIS